MAMGKMKELYTIGQDIQNLAGDINEMLWDNRVEDAVIAALEGVAGIQQKMMESEVERVALSLEGR